MARRKKEGGRWRSHRVRWGGAEQEEGRKSAAKPRRRSCRFGIAQIAGRPGLRGVENSAARYFAPAPAQKKGPGEQAQPGPQIFGRPPGGREGGGRPEPEGFGEGETSPAALQCSNRIGNRMSGLIVQVRRDFISHASHAWSYPRFRQRPSYHPQASPKAFGVISRIRKSLSAATRTDPFNSDA